MSLHKENTTTVPKIREVTTSQCADDRYDAGKIQIIYEKLTQNKSASSDKVQLQTAAPFRCISDPEWERSAKSADDRKETRSAAYRQTH